MSRYRLYPTPAQEAVLREHCAHARYVWNLAVEKAPGRVEKVSAAFTSQRCSACGQVDRKSRESQAVFRCTACGFACNADVNAARNIAAGHAVTARGGYREAGPVNREPQLLASLIGRERLESPAFRRERMSRDLQVEGAEAVDAPGRARRDPDGGVRRVDDGGAGERVAGPEVRPSHDRRQGCRLVRPLMDVAGA